MNKLKHILIASLLTVSNGIFAQDIETKVESKVQNVNLFEQGASIDRYATIQLSKGKNTIIFDKLSHVVDMESIQLAGRGFSVYSIDFNPSYNPENKLPAHIEKLSQEVDDLEIKIADINLSIKLASDKIAFLQTNKSIGNNSSITANQLATTYELYSQKLKQASEEKLKFERESQKLRKELNFKQRELNNFVSQLRHKGAIIATLHADQAISTKVKLNYTVRNASWIPIYDIRFSSLEEELTLIQNAKVSQTTGNDWNNIELSVSTGNALSQENLPHISPWKINLYPTYSKSKMMRSRVVEVPDELEINEEIEVDLDVDIEYDSENWESQEEVYKAPTNYISARQSTSTISKKFTFEKKFDIQSEDTEQQVQLRQEEIKAEFKYKAVPKYSQNVFLVAEIPNWESYGFENGKANIYMSDQYRGKTYLNKGTIGEDYIISLGKDSDIAVERSQIKDSNSRRFLGSKKKEVFAWEILVKNNKNSAAQIEIKDQIPVSLTDKIIITTEELSGANHDKSTGMLTWDLNLQANEIKKLVFKYTVESPKNERVGY
ncbi:DUF4139 domain-containing protein [Aureibacter tunicatorum]|uniref:Uncharacterized protein (TIGR02231 family) n=1 Tax=Aureibacter tunicatorum TaxID=866807 RepID=A0AAE4BSR9_9BACT|nr:DUF4139 domain-containing protein [Aureibacter tunicatorum]MDR6241494.1 uncharacterized protein (TIGR02231 family) [Aureibacter tunicatorum]BDD06663.1 hypothetical protein AUTU_41460 [Aureibacter tunicatorum]